MTVENLKEFRLSLKDLEEEITEAIEEQVIGKVTLDIFADVTRQSPVDSGRFRASWSVSQGQPSTFEQPEGSSNAIRSSEAESVADKSTIGSTNYIVNNLPYAERLAMGYSPQAESGWVDSSIKRALRGVE